MSSPGVAAYFDMDGTVISRSTIAAYVRQLRREGLLGVLEQLQLLGWGLLYRIGLFRPERAYSWMATRLAGRREEDLYAEGERWFEEIFAPHVYLEAQELVAGHVEQGERVVLLTASSPYLARPLARALGIADEDLLCSRFASTGGVLSGSMLEPICYGEGKVAHARRHADQFGYDLRRSFFYTDSISDLPMLQAVGHPRVVNPDRLLRRHARRAGWPVLSFHRTRGRAHDGGVRPR